MRYLRSECHLAENTVLAYDRDLRRFLDWLGSRRIEGLTISDLAGYPAWLTEQELAPASDQPARRVAQGLLPLPAARRVLTENQAELLGTQKLWQRVPTVLSARRNRRAARRAEAAAAVVAARSGDAGTALRDRLPRVGAFDAEAARRAS